jgi:hypothetical protein
MSADPQRRSRLLAAALPALSLLAVAGWSLLAHLSHTGRAPSEAEWDAARAVVREGWQEGDVLRQAPIWADEARQGMFGFDYDPAREVEGPNLWGYQRLWIITDADHRDDAIDDLPGGFELLEEWAPADRTRVLLVSVPPADSVAFDARRDLRSAVVRRFAPGEPAGAAAPEVPESIESCELYHEGAWHCGHIDQWTYVGDSLEEVAGSLRRCVYVGVPERPVRITWPAASLGPRLQGDFGNTMAAVRAERGSDVRFEVSVDGQPVWEHLIGKWDQALHAFDVEVPGGPGQHQVTVTVGATGEFFDRWLCFRAWSMGGG